MSSGEFRLFFSRIRYRPRKHLISELSPDIDGSYTKFTKNRESEDGELSPHSRNNDQILFSKNASLGKEFLHRVRKTRGSAMQTILQQLRVFIEGEETDE